MIEIIKMWWWAVSELWGWAMCIVVPFLLYRWMTRGLR